jgi:hypothetical protein
MDSVECVVAGPGVIGVAVTGARGLAGYEVVVAEASPSGLEPLRAISR